MSETMFLKCNRTGNLMFSTKEAERHAEETGFQDFAQVAPDAPVLVVADGRKLKLLWDMEEFTRFKQRTRADDLEAESMSVREYKLKLDSLQSMVPAALAPADATPMDTSDEALVNAAAAASSAPPSSAAAAVQPMDTGDTVADQAISMLPGVEALQEPGLSDGQTKMVRETAEGGGFVAVVYKWEMKAAKWTKHREVVDEDQPAELDAAEKALAVANTEFCQSLMEMGFPEYRCKKALLLTGNDSVEHGIQWLTEHVEDPLADAPLTIAQVKAALKPKLTKEEKLARASELQKRAQETRKKREAAEKIEKERAQRESGKKTTEQMRLMQEQEQKNFIEQRKREKAEEKALKEKMRAKLDADRAARGFAPLEKKVAAPTQGLGQAKLGNVPTGKLRGELRSLKSEHPDRKDVAFKTLLAYCTNIVENPAEPKFRRIKKENKAFVARIKSCGERGTNFLAVCGFADDGGEFLQIVVPEGGSFEADVLPTVKAAKIELEKSINNPFWL